MEKRSASGLPPVMEKRNMNAGYHNRGTHRPGHKKQCSGVIYYVLLFLTSLIFVGLFFSFTMMPSEEQANNGIGANSIISRNIGGKKPLSEQITNWIPKHHVNASAPVEFLPDYSEEFWTPIDVEIATDPIIVLCKLNFKKYSEAPHLYPMFKDLLGASECRGSNRKRESLSTLMKEIEDDKKAGRPGGKVVEPTGFVFHESRVGSTLVANFLASDPYNMVFSESAPVANAILHCSHCSREETVKLFRDVLTLMGRSPIHKRLFIKSQSITSTKMDIAFEAFPETPWAFVYRQPVQTMMSHLDPKKGGDAAPCLRSKRNPPEKVLEAINANVDGGKKNAPKEAWCASHLNMLCSAALDAYDTYGTRVDERGRTVQRGMLINYDSLPGYFPKVILPLFSSVPSNSWLAKISDESKQYSKGRKSGRSFTGDSKDKDERATEDIQLYANKILLPSYDLLNRKAEDGFKRFMPNMYNEVQISLGDQKVVDWTKLKELPFAEEPRVLKKVEIETEAEALELKPPIAPTVEIPHIPNEKPSEFKAWIPFANHHSSQPRNTIDCSLDPNPDNYPIAYSMIDITNNWGTDDTNIPPFHYDSLCHFDYQNETQIALAYKYREAELPFVAYNIPELNEVVRKWGNIDYLQNLFGTKDYRTEKAESNHFMYWRSASKKFLRSEEGKDWKAPTNVITRKFDDWLETAVKGQNKSLEDRSHEYFRISSDQGSRFLYDELPFFQPKKSLMMVDPKEQRGIHCRFGMRSVIAEAHFDGSRNAVVLLGGLRRWILTHPDQCENMHMLPPKHPSGRHSQVDWSKPDIKKFPNFAKVMGNEVILAPGDFLFVPTYWIHYIISLNVNFQCNTRSGASRIYDKHIRKCGF